MRTWLLSLLVLTACQRADVRAVVFYDFVQLDESAAGEHYEQFVDLNGGVVSFGCFVVELRQTNCFDMAGTGEPNFHLGVVECECPCLAAELDPCDPTRGLVRAGTIRGVIDQVEGPLVLGGVEIPVNVDLAPASRLFITVEANTDTSPQPSGDIVLDGPLDAEGAVIRGLLDNPGTSPVNGRVTIVPVQDEVWL